jgi:hypothetical protein
MRELADGALTGRSLEGGSLELRFRRDPTVDRQVADLVARERECCPFLDFDVVPGDELTVRIHAPKGAEATLEAWI